MKKYYLFSFYLLSVFGDNINGYEFDDTHSCESMLPKLQSGNDTNLSVVLTDSPYKITVSSPKYRRNRRLKVKLDGGEFNGFILQARQYSNSLGRTTVDNPVYIGNFIDFPPYLKTLDCGKGPSFSVSNTIYYYNSTHTKKSVDIPWQGPLDDVGSIEFVATIIVGNKYWNPVKSHPLLFNEFPPSLLSCGVGQSCYSYLKLPIGEMSSQYTLVANVFKTDVIFVIGGKVDSDAGYVGIAFTNSTMTFVDMCVCIKSDPKTVKAAHYIRNPHEKPKKVDEELEDVETDIDGEYVWCKFRRPLKPASSKAADLNYGMTQIFLWGKIESEELRPIYPKEADLVEVSEPWNHTLTMKVIHIIGGSNVPGISWTLLCAALLATLIQLF